ncbi:DUF6133 family protein [uncultured Tyzzerella sp.]|uniref:DUF6133 family protein n=1 Tax=uncultured Tyzzerella sp. TaxID=2321398 RepID=UPI002943605F|nr:DUF6133 family protein [uncultured Tyzzerella sp.]
MSDLILKMSAKKDIAKLNIKEKVKKCLSCNKGEGYMGGAVGIIIIIVVGALIMGALYLAFNGTIIPKVNDKINELFNYRG